MGVRFPVTFLKVCTGAYVCALASNSVYRTTFCIIIGESANDNASFPISCSLWVGSRMLPVTAGSWSRHPQPHCCGSTVGGGSPRWLVVSLFLPPHPHPFHSSTSSHLTGQGPTESQKVPSGNTPRKSYMAIPPESPLWQHTYTKKVLYMANHGGSYVQILSRSLDAQGRWSRAVRYGGFLEQTLSAPQRWEHCQWLFTPMTVVSPPPASRSRFVQLVFGNTQCGISLP